MLREELEGRLLPEAQGSGNKGLEFRSVLNGMENDWNVLGGSGEGEGEQD